MSECKKCLPYVRRLRSRPARAPLAWPLTRERPRRVGCVCYTVYTLRRIYTSSRLQIYKLLIKQMLARSTEVERTPETGE
eukprot:scaffold90682_cov72-Phaeocystis_antarctica.AAC.2